MPAPWRSFLAPNDSLVTLRRFDLSSKLLSHARCATRPSIPTSLTDEALPFLEKKRKRGRSIVPSENFDTLDFSTLASGRVDIVKVAQWCYRGLYGQNFIILLLRRIGLIRNIIMREYNNERDCLLTRSFVLAFKILCDYVI